jgi:hypothetical protein
MQTYLSVVDFVLVQNALENLGRDVRGCAGQLHVQLNTALVVALEVHVRLSLVQTDTKS